MKAKRWSVLIKMLVTRARGFLGAVLAAAVLAAGCGNGAPSAAPDLPKPGDAAAIEPSSAKSVMTAFDWNEEGDRVTAIYDELVERFNARQDLDTSLEVQRIQGEPYWTKLNAVIAANNAPD